MTLTYKNYVLQRLTDYAAASTALLTIPGRRQTLKLKREALKVKRTDSDPISGGGNRTEDAWLTNLAEDEYLSRKFKAAKWEVHDTSEHLKALDPEELKVVEGCCIHRSKGDIDRLCEEMGYERSAVYNIRDRALRKLARSMTGGATV